MNLDYIKYDDNGYPYNGMFPPTEDLLNGNDGYDSIGKGVFFYDYAVRGYNIDFNYKGKHYALMGWMDGVPIALLDADDKELQRFEDPWMPFSTVRSMVGNSSTSWRNLPT